MDILQGLTSNSRQTFNFTVEQQKSVTMNLYYFDTQMSWYFDIIFGEFTVYGLKLVLAPNILRAFKNIIPFGLQVFTTNESDVIDPLYSDDFSSERVQIGVLSREEVIQVENIVYKAK